MLGARRETRRNYGAENDRRRAPQQCLTHKMGGCFHLRNEVCNLRSTSIIRWIEFLSKRNKPYSWARVPGAWRGPPTFGKNFSNWTARSVGPVFVRAVRHPFARFPKVAAEIRGALKSFNTEIIIHVIQGFGRRRRGRLFDQDAIGGTFDSMARSPIAPRPGPGDRNGGGGMRGPRRARARAGTDHARVALLCSWAGDEVGSRSVGLEIESI